MSLLGLYIRHLLYLDGIVDVNLSLGRILYDAGLGCKKSMVLAHVHVLARKDSRSSLPYDD